MATNLIMPKQKSSAARPAAYPYPKKGGKKGYKPQESQNVGAESQDVGGGHPKPQ